MRLLSKPKRGVWEIEVKERIGNTGNYFLKISTIGESIELTGRENWEAYIPRNYFDFEPKLGKRYEVIIEEYSKNGKTNYIIKRFPWGDEK